MHFCHLQVRVANVKSNKSSTLYNASSYVVSLAHRCSIAFMFLFLFVDVVHIIYDVLLVQFYACLYLHIDWYKRYVLLGFPIAQSVVPKGNLSKDLFNVCSSAYSKSFIFCSFVKFISCISWTVVQKSITYMDNDFQPCFIYPMLYKKKFQAAHY